MKSGITYVAFAMTTLSLGACATHEQIDAQNEQLASNYLSTAQSVISDRTDMDFKDGDVYFKAPDERLTAPQFSESLNTCIQFDIGTYLKGGEGVQVARSLGYSEAKIINEGSRLCMESKGWSLYKMIKGQMEHVAYGGQNYASMSELEVKSFRNLVITQRAWYLRYAPAVLAVGDLKQ